MSKILLAVGLTFMVCRASAQDSETLQRGKQVETHSCTPCHSLRIIESQRLSSAAWDKEITKMIGWGAEVSDRRALLDYLSQEYSAAKPMARTELTQNGAKAGSDKSH